MADQHHEAAAHGSYKSYFIGFVLAVILTVIPFWMVMEGNFSKGVTLASIFLLALVQLVVHVYFFLHINSSKEQRMNLTVFLYTGLVLAIILAGNAWIFMNIHHLMMP
jgi:cytochrome o ubiquinol oxidase operon protein cyoD